MATLKKRKAPESAPPIVSEGDSASADGQPELNDHVAFETEGLVSDTALDSPIYDKSGLLLLAKGALVTSRFKELLVVRGIRSVMLSRTDADSMMSRQVDNAGLAKASIDVDSDVVKKLDEIVESGQLFAHDSSPKFRDRLVRHGCSGNNQHLRERLIAKHAETCSLLDDMIKAAAHGETMNGGDISSVVADYLSHLTLDSDLVAEVMERARDFAVFAQHCLQTALLGMSLALELNMGEDAVRVIGLAGMLHDWGMVYVPKEIIEAKRTLTRMEFINIRKHPIFTVNMLERVTGLPPQVALICYQVHERPSGDGYPRGKQEGSIHPCARILNVADQYIALTSPRPFRPALNPHAANDCLLRQASRNLVDKMVVRALLRILTLYGIGRRVELSDGRKGHVLRRNGEQYHRPIIQINETADGKPVHRDDPSAILNLSKSELTVARVLPIAGREELDTCDSVMNLNCCQM